MHCLEVLLQEIGKRKDKAGRIFLLFCGDVDAGTGESWCPDCVEGEMAPPTPLSNLMGHCGVPLTNDSTDLHSAPSRLAPQTTLATLVIN